MTIFEDPDETIETTPDLAEYAERVCRWPGHSVRGLFPASSTFKDGRDATCFVDRFGNLLEEETAVGHWPGMGEIASVGFAE